MGEPQQNEPKADDLQGAGSNARAQDDSRSGVQNTPTQDDSRSGKLLLGAVTIGQAPRTDVTADIAPLLGPNVRVIEAGALDGQATFRRLPRREANRHSLRAWPTAQA